MLWPQRPDTWRGGGKPAQRAFVEAGAADIARFEPVTMGVNGDQYENARAMLPASRTRRGTIQQRRLDARYAARAFVVNDGSGEVRGVDWIFNAWGGLQKMMYFPWDKDDLVAAQDAGDRIACLDTKRRWCWKAARSTSTDKAALTRH